MAAVHEFAFYTTEVETIHTLPTRTDFTITDKELLRRLINIIRVKTGDIIILFNEQYNVRCSVLHVSRLTVSLLVLESEVNKVLTPSVHWLVPFLERSAFETVVSVLTVLGAKTITPVLTQKVHRTTMRQTERRRFDRIMIAASEQSKQFIFPHIESTVHFSDIESLMSGLKTEQRLFFDPEGHSSRELITALEGDPTSQIICMVGPEGDLVEAEKQHLHGYGFTSYALTPSVLRSELAVTVAMGLIRAIL